MRKILQEPRLKCMIFREESLKDCKMPVVVFLDNQDEVICYGSSLKSKSVFNPQDTLVMLEGQAHNGITDNPTYKTELQRILAR